MTPSALSFLKVAMFFLASMICSCAAVSGTTVPSLICRGSAVGGGTKSLAGAGGAWKMLAIPLALAFAAAYACEVAERVESMAAGLPQRFINAHGFLISPV